jgi:AraC family transcriptional regulator of adaptative response/methylated-DNA-[protein]-cysteine methyltransferase
MPVILNTATPAEIKAQGRGMAITTGIARSPFGYCLIAESPRGICHLSFFDPGGKTKAIGELCAAWPNAEITWDHEHAAKLIDGIFPPASPSTPPLKFFVRGTAFQLRVWRSLLQVPRGACVSYAILAAAAGNPRACRATGSAVGANPVAFLIPCHRVIRSDGTTGQYRWGTVRKSAMLAWEKS